MQSHSGCLNSPRSGRVRTPAAGGGATIRPGLECRNLFLYERLGSARGFGDKIQRFAAIVAIEPNARPRE